VYLPEIGGLTYGNVVTIGGILGTSELDRILGQPEATVTGGPVVIAPLGMATSGLGGSDLNQWTLGVENGRGPCNIGLLVRSWGKVVASTASYFTMTDGTREVKVLSTANPGLSGPCYAIVTGISSWENSGGHMVPVIIATGAIQVTPLP